ncbi:MAG: hypothetical protein IJY92_04490 [Alphaproteobacteria bacterium]|nr:hypothetical protein [Alphaproteobacteria bacterium]
MAQDFKIKEPYQDNPVLFETLQALLKGRYYRATNQTEYDFSKVTKALQENPHLIDSQAENGDTVMHILAKNQDKVFKDISFNELFKLGANPFVQNNAGFTPRGLVSLRSFPDAHGQLSAYESSYQAMQLGKALVALKDLFSYQTYQKTPRGNSIEPDINCLQPSPVQKAKRVIDIVAQKLSGNINQNS